MQELPSFKNLIDRNVWVKIVDIGANPIDGDQLYTTMIENGSAEVVGFEPNPEALSVLLQRKGPHETYLPHAVADGKRHTLYCCQAPGMTSLFCPDPAVLELFNGLPDWGRVLSTQEIDTVRLDDVPETEGAEFIKLDIQGAELLALENASDRLVSTLVIQTEVEFMPLYKDQPLFSDIERYLRGVGFILHRFFSEVSRVIRPMTINDDIYAGFSQLCWADAIFVRDITRLDLLSEEQLLKMAAIVHDLYGSIDLCMHLLAEYDRRTKAMLAARYLVKLQRA